MGLSKDEFPTNLPPQYKKCFEELHELLNLIFFALKGVKDKAWRRKLAEMCILALGVQELSEIRERLERRSNGEETENYIG